MVQIAFRKKAVIATNVEESHQRVNSSPPVMGKTSLTIDEPYQMHLRGIEALNQGPSDKGKVVPIPDSLARARKRDESRMKTSAAVPTITTHPTAETVLFFPNLTTYDNSPPSQPSCSHHSHTTDSTPCYSGSSDSGSSGSSD